MKHLNNYELIELDRTKSVSSVEKKSWLKLENVLSDCESETINKYSVLFKVKYHAMNFGLIIENENRKQTLEACA